MTKRQMAADGASQVRWASGPRAKLSRADLPCAPRLRPRWPARQDRGRPGPPVSSAAESTLLLRPVIEYNLAVQRLAASTAPGGEGIDSAAAAYDKASAKVSETEAVCSAAVTLAEALS